MTSASILLAPVLLVVWLIVWLVDPPLPGPVAAVLRIATWITGAVFGGFVVLASPFVLWYAGLAVVQWLQGRQQARLDARRAEERRAAQRRAELLRAEAPRASERAARDEDRPGP